MLYEISEKRRLSMFGWTKHDSGWRMGFIGICSPCILETTRYQAPGEAEEIMVYQAPDEAEEIKGPYSHFHVAFSPELDCNRWLP